MFLLGPQQRPSRKIKNTEKKKERSEKSEKNLKLFDSDNYISYFEIYITSSFELITDSKPKTENFFFFFEEKSLIMIDFIRLISLESVPEYEH